MNAVLKLFLSMSVSGSVLILILLLGKGFWRNKISRQWQYYIWLVVVLRLLLPFGPEATLFGKVYGAVDQAVARTVTGPRQQPLLNLPAEGSVPTVNLPQEGGESPERPGEDLTMSRAFEDIGVLLGEHIWLVWLMGALGLLIRKVTIYQGFMRYIRAGLTPVSDTGILDRLALAAERAGVRKPVELCVNPLISSPLLTGFFHPCILLPQEDMPEKDFTYIALHELTHYRRRDMFYKWLVQVVVCLHWFNPLVHLMSREIEKACEFSCDEAVLAKMGRDKGQEYGKVLLDAMAAVGRYKENPGAVTLNRNKKLLKERLGAIMREKERSGAVKALTAGLTVCVALGAFFAGTYPVGNTRAAALPQEPAEAGALPDGTAGGLEEWSETISGTAGGLEEEPETINRAAGGFGEWYGIFNGASTEIERYYEDKNLAMFQMSFCCLDEEAQSQWLERIYADGDFALMGTAVGVLEEDCAQIRQLAETVYRDGSVAFFPLLAMHMSQETLEEWLDRTLEEENLSFQPILYNALGRGDEFEQMQEKQENEWAEAYLAVGVRVDGKDYYYQGELVHIFLDKRRTDQAFYTLQMNPKGTVNIKILRNENNEITGAAYMTEEEVKELFGDMEEPDSLPVDLETIAAGEIICLGEYTLSLGDRIRYDIFAETGEGMKVFFTRKDREDVVYWSVHNLRQEGEPLRCYMDETVGSWAEPGSYQLFLQATEGDLEKVKGSVLITSED